MGAAENVQSGDTEQHWILAHIAQLTRLLNDLWCPDSGETGLSVNVCDGEQHGFSAKLALRCDGCRYQNFEMSSPRIDDSNKQTYEINSKMVMFSHEVGGSHTVLTAFGTAIGMPTMHLKTYQRQDKKVTAAEIDAGSDLLDRTSIAVRRAYSDTDEDLQEALDRGETPVIDISVSFDGTWQKRGFTSLYGVGVCINVLTGLVHGTSFMGLKRVQGSVALAVCIFNEGATELINLMNRMYVNTSYVTLQHLSRKDDKRVSKADAATTARARKHRKDSAIQRRLNIREEDVRDGLVYGAGLH